MNNGIQELLTYVLIGLIVILVLLVIIFIILKTKEKLKNKNLKDITDKDKNKKEKEKPQKQYNRQSVLSFMEFEKVEDNMIIQKEKKKYLMVVEAQGVNYDLMSGVEKNGVEQGFVQFLNTLRHPIQIYIQTRTVNLDGSINNYKKRLKKVQENYRKAEMDYTSRVNSGRYDEKQIEHFKIEYVKQRNLYEYGSDIIKNTEQMSFNKNILTKNYYIIIPYFYEEIESKKYNEEEIKNIAFSELYTKAQAIISSLYVCGIKGKVMDSMELIELLYVAYNRDDSELYNLDKMMAGGFEDLYSTSQDVLEKRSKELDKRIQEEAEARANEVVLQAIEENEKEKEIREKEDNLEKLINQMAKMFISENEQYIGVDVANKAKTIIDEGPKENEESKEKEEKSDVKEKKKTTTRRKRSQ